MPAKMPRTRKKSLGPEDLAKIFVPNRDDYVAPEPSELETIFEIKTPAKSAKRAISGSAAAHSANFTPTTSADVNSTSGLGENGRPTRGAARSALSAISASNSADFDASSGSLESGRPSRNSDFRLGFCKSLRALKSDNYWIQDEERESKRSMMLKKHFKGKKKLKLKPLSPVQELNLFNIIEKSDQVEESPVKTPAKKPKTPAKRGRKSKIREIKNGKNEKSGKSDDISDEKEDLLDQISDKASEYNENLENIPENNSFNEISRNNFSVQKINSEEEESPMKIKNKTPIKTPDLTKKTPKVNSKKTPDPPKKTPKVISKKTPKRPTPSKKSRKSRKISGLLKEIPENEILRESEIIENSLTTPSPLKPLRTETEKRDSSPFIKHETSEARAAREAFERQVKGAGALLGDIKTDFRVDENSAEKKKKANNNKRESVKLMIRRSSRFFQNNSPSNAPGSVFQEHEFAINKTKGKRRSNLIRISDVENSVKSPRFL